MTALEIGLYPDATPDEQIAYSMGWNTATTIARTEAFAAIRRAAAVARAAEEDAIILGRQGDSTFAAYAESEALGIRRAIRAAIGSEKAS